MTCDASTVVAAAVNLVSLSDDLLAGVQTARLNLNPSGPAVTPQSLEDAASGFRKLNQRQHLAVDTYLLAVINAGSVVPATILASAIDFERLSARQFDECKAYLIANKAGGSMTAAGLASSGAAYQGYSPKDHWAAQTYCLAVIAGGSTNPQTLVTLSRAFMAVSEKQLQTMQIWLLCEWNSAAPCVDVPAQQVPVLQNETYASDVLDTFEILLPQVCCNPASVQIYECYNPDGTDGVLYQTEIIDASHAGEVNYIIPITVMSAFNRPYVVARQVCSDTGASGWSNVIQVGDPALADTMASTWSALVVTNGGAAPGAPTVAAVSQFYAEITAYGIGSKLKLVNLFAPDSFIASMTPQYSAWGSSFWDKINVTAKGFGQAVHGIHGIEPDSSSGIWTGFNPSGTGGFSVNNFGATLYTNHPDFLQGRSGGRSGSNYLSIFPSFNGTWFFDWPDNGGATRVTATIPARFRGFVSYNRSAANLAEVWYANRNTGFLFGGDSVAAISATAPNATMYIGAFNDTGTFEAGACRGYGAAAYHLALNALEAEKFYHAIENFRRAIGGGYIPLETSASEVVTEYQNNIYYGSGVALSAGTRTALETFWSALVTANIHEKMLVVVPYVPDNLTAAITPMRFIGTNRQLTNVNFIAGDLTVNGLVGDALTKYLNTVFFIPSRFFFDWTDIGLTLYISAGKNEASNDGAVYSGGAAAGYSVQNFANSMYSDTGVVATGRIGPIADVAATGYYSGNRVAADDHRLYKAKSTFAHAQIGSNLNVTVDARGTLTWPLVMHAFNTAGTVGGFTSKRHSFFAIHLGLSSSESSAFYNAIQALRTALGGGFV